MSRGPVAYKREEVPSHRVNGTDYLIHFLKLYIDDDGGTESSTSRAAGMPRLSLVPADAKKAVAGSSGTRPKKRRKAATARRGSLPRATPKPPSRRYGYGIKRRKKKKKKSSSGKKQKTSYMPVVVLSPPEPSGRNEVRDCRDCYDLGDRGRGRSPPRRRRYSLPPHPHSQGRRPSSMQRSPNRRRSPARGRSPARRRSPPPRSPTRRRARRPPGSPYRQWRGSPPRPPPPTERHDHPDWFVSGRADGARSGNAYVERVPAWAMPPRDDVFSPREGHVGDKLDLLTRMLKEMKSEMNDVKGRMRRRKLASDRRRRKQRPAAQPTIITIPGQGGHHSVLLPCVTSPESPWVPFLCSCASFCTSERAVSHQRSRGSYMATRGL